jgi:DNA-directed RNA polymerase sigma subunit (sigma70/sigma32)
MNAMEAGAAQDDNSGAIHEFTCPDSDTATSCINLKTMYFQEVGRVRRLCRREERAITELAAAGGEGAAAALAASYLRMVIKVAIAYARRLPYPGTVILDLIQEGNAALLLTARRFSPDYGAPFSFTRTRT